MFQCKEAVPILKKKSQAKNHLPHHGLKTNLVQGEQAITPNLTLIIKSRDPDLHQLQDQRQLWEEDQEKQEGPQKISDQTKIKCSKVQHLGLSKEQDAVVGQIQHQLLI